MCPRRVQRDALARLAGARRWVWNWALRRWKDTYAATGKSIGLKQLSAALTALKNDPETAWLKEADSQALQQTLKDLHRGFVNFFEKRARYPRFKSRKRDKARFRIPQRVTIEDGKVYVPKVGQVRIRQSQEVDGPTKSASFRREADGHWYVSLVTEFEMPDVPLPLPLPERTLGIDFGLGNYATFSDGSEPIPAPKFRRRRDRKLRRSHRALSRCERGSKRREKARKRLSRVYQKTSNQRKDFIHQLTIRIVRDHDAVCLEDLSLRALARTKLSRSVLDAGIGEAKRQFQYKAVWHRRHCVVIDRFFPSSKQCRHCGALNDALTLKDREWDCPVCGAHHDRDFNAACNIRDEGLRILAVGHTEETKRSWRPCQTRDTRAVVVESRIPRL
jgi:putative transposase